MILDRTAHLLHRCRLKFSALTPTLSRRARGEKPHHLLWVAVAGRGEALAPRKDQAMFLIIQNDPQCPPGSCLQLLGAAGQPCRTIAGYGDEPFPSPSSLTGIIVLGGEMSAHDTEKFPYLLRVRAFIRAALEAGTPLLGICLGGQLLALVAGGEVRSPSPHGEQGIHRVDLNHAGLSDPLFAGFGRTFVTFQLHNDSFTVPPGGVHLGSSPACPSQAFRLGRHAYGLQFHPEVDRAIVSSWGAFFTPPRDFLSGFLAGEIPFKAASHAILANFIALAAAARQVEIPSH